MCRKSVPQLEKDDAPRVSTLRPNGRVRGFSGEGLRVGADCLIEDLIVTDNDLGEIEVNHFVVTPSL
jgi:hypothetical protein